MNLQCLRYYDIIEGFTVYACNDVVSKEDVFRCDCVETVPGKGGYSHVIHVDIPVNVRRKVPLNLSRENDVWNSTTALLYSNSLRCNVISLSGEFCTFSAT